MGQGYLLDTNTIVYFLEGTLNKSGKKFVLEKIQNGAHISIISKIELLSWNAPKKTNTDKLSILINDARIYSLDESVAPFDLTKSIRFRLLKN